MLPHPAISNATDVVQSYPNKSAAGLICNKPVDLQQHHCYGCRFGGGVDRRHAAVARRGRRDTVTQWHQTRVVKGKREYARMDLVFNLNGSATYLDVSVVAPFFVAKRAEKSNFDSCPHINLVPTILETTCRLGWHARKFINNLMKNAHNPSLAIRDLVSHPERIPPQCHLRTTTYSRRNVTVGQPYATPCSVFYALPRDVKCKYRPYGNTRRSYSLKPASVAQLCPGHDDTSSDDDEHNTSNTLLLLVADACIAPALLAGLSDVHEFKIALGCKYALDMFMIAQQNGRSPDLDNLPLDPNLEPWF